MVKREYQEVKDEDEIDSLTPNSKIKKEIVEDRSVTISSAKTPPKETAKTQSSKSTGGVEGPDTPKSKSPAKSVSPSLLYLKIWKANDSDGPHQKMKSLLE